MRVVEVLDGGTDGGFELENCLAVVRDLVVDDDLEFHAILVHDTLQRCEKMSAYNREWVNREKHTRQVNPDVVSVCIFESVAIL